LEITRPGHQGGVGGDRLEESSGGQKEEHLQAFSDELAGMSESGPGKKLRAKRPAFEERGPEGVVAERSESRSEWSKKKKAHVLKIAALPSRNVAGGGLYKKEKAGKEKRYRGTRGKGKKGRFRPYCRV